MSYKAWTQWEVEYLIHNWDKKYQQEIADALGRSTATVIWKGTMLRKAGIGCFKETRLYSSLWSERELEILTNNYGIKPNKEIARLVGRTAMAVETRAKRMRLSVYSNFYSYKVLAHELNKSPAVLRKYVENGWLKAKRAHFSSVYGHKPMIIMEDDIVKFLKAHYTNFDPQKIRHPYFQNVVREAYRNNHGNEYKCECANYPMVGHYPPAKLVLSY